MTEQVKDGDVVRVRYTGRYQDGEVFDSTDGRAPFTFVVGSGAVVKGFDEAVIGMRAGERTQVTIGPDKAYGPHKEEYVLSIPRSSMPAQMSVSTGMQLKLPLQGGKAMTATVTKVTRELIRLDGNHPMAGKTLVFDIEIVATGLKPTDLFGG
ncbi:peptidylprolyl cis-trans isomerase, FKBP-type [Syntrophotalea carbinolica DSM 2380]|uniref:Peptidyl-prolyl cis-trans isomerase n=1 Tax=Syntrophotalea carbinolica (strain DSM 2380 / NBRC 103641 / GraBd1) TaxID=338963 RepID=Q3A2U0_SYNC1|nr:peptidylprolyl isomerase [Syntrophotalea carbinolica]ABA89317.1 peptidylprolyl cis-trans isomerase, FKBP-type [Syntrophotalea carbinolica DSM 2380]